MNIELRTETTENDIDVRHADGLCFSPCTLRVRRHHERRCGMHLFTVEVPEAKLPKLLRKFKPIPQ
jgi:hypothetical protein